MASESSQLEQSLKKIWPFVPPLRPNGVGCSNHIVSHTSSKDHGLAGNGMIELQPLCVEQRSLDSVRFAQSFVPVRQAVDVVAIDGSVSVLQMHPNLVRPTCLDSYLHNGQLPIECERVDERDCSTSLLRWSSVFR